MITGFSGDSVRHSGNGLLPRACFALICIITLGAVGSASAGTIVVPTGGDLQTALNAAQCGDSVVLQAGATWDGTFRLPNRNCTAATPITVRSSGTGALPNGRVGPANTSNMARIRSLGGSNDYGAAISAAAGAGWWILDGLELTDNAPPTASIQWLLDFSESTTHDLTVQRCYIHQKESGTNYNRTVQRAIDFEGRGLTAKWNYIYVIGYYYPEVAGGSSTMQMDSTAFLCVGCSTMLIEDNYISTWWNNLFLGGGDSAPQNTATLTGATTSSATFSNTTGLTAGVVIRFEFTVTGTFDKTGLNDSCDGTFPANGSAPFSAATVTRTGGATLNTGDGNHYGITRNASDSFDGYVGICSVSGSSYRLARTKSASSTAGPVTLTVYETAIVTSVNGATVNYTPYGRDELMSNGATSASWNSGDQGLINDITVRRNTFYVDPAFAHDVNVKKGYSPKGLYEIKSVNRFTFEGNYVLGYPAVMAIYPGNQYGSAPWTTCQNVTIRNNWIAPDLGYPESTREAMTLIDASNYGTVAPRKNFFVYNNLIKNVASFASFKVSDNVQLYHNTVLNTAPSTFSYHAAFTSIAAPTTNYVFRDNIIAYSAYGANCSIPPGTLGICWPGGTFRNNVIVNTENTTASNGGALGSGIWGTNSVIAPVFNSFSSLAFTDPASENYKLVTGSSYTGMATDGYDPGVDWDALMVALLSSNPNPTPTPTPGGGNAVATFVQVDSTTQGNWKSGYGADGFNVINDTVNYPSYAQVSPISQQTFVWASSTSANPGLQKAFQSDRIAACWYQSPSFSIEVNITDGQTHRMALYALDWDLMPRVETIDIVDANTNALLDSRTVSAFSGGQYFVWNVKGHIKINVAKVVGSNAAISGIFFGGPLSGSPTPTPTPSPSPGQNTPPTVTLTVPAQGASFVAGSNITLVANAVDADGTVSKVDFYRGITLIGTSTTSPYSFVWTNAAAGTHSLSAIATDNQGAITTSSVVSISVNNSPNSVNRAKGLATTLANGLSSALSGSSTHHALSSNVVAVTDLVALTAEISDAQQEFLLESSSFGSLAPTIGVQMKAALLFNKATTGLASRVNSSTVRDNLLRVATHLAIAEDLMRFGAITQPTAAQAIATRTRTNVVVGQAQAGYGTTTASPVAPSSLGSIAGNPSISPMTSQTAFANLNVDGSLPYELAGITVTVDGISVPVLYVSPSVIKFFMPADAQLRTAEVIVASQDGYICEGSVVIGRDGSRLMTMADDDNGAAVVTNSRKMTATDFDVETDENFGPDKRTRLTLFATGISGGAVNSDTSNDVTINGVTRPNFAESVSVEARCSDGRVFTLPVEFAGVQGVLPGVDQLNVVLVPELRSAGAVSLTLIINGQRSNAPTVFVR